MPANPIAKYANNFMAFADDLVVQLPGGAGPLGPRMADFQRRDFGALAPALHALAAGQIPPTRRYWIERTKGGSKDSDAAVAMLWLLAFSRRQLRIQAAADDFEQADEIRLIIKQILKQDGQLNAALKEVIDVQRNAILSSRHDSVVQILTRDARGGHGARADMVLINELSHIGDKEFVETVADNADKVPHNVTLICTNAGHVGTWQEQWRNIALADRARWYFSALTTPAPWISVADLAEAAKRNSSNRFARLWGGQWVASTGNGIPQSNIDAAIKRDLQPTKKRKRAWAMIGGLDLSKSRDSTGFIILGKKVGCTEVVETLVERPKESDITTALRENGILPPLPRSQEQVRTIRGDGRLRLFNARLWRPQDTGGKVSQTSVENAILKAHERYQFEAVAYDPHDASLLAERLINQGVPMVETTFSGTNLVAMANTALEEFADGNVELYDHPQLIADLRRMQIVEKSYGQRLSAKRTNSEGHADLGTAFLLAMLASREFVDPLGDVLVTGPLIW
ncbi:MAG TPA: terminase large subunit [Pirellulales bacterium]|nr:terminase large subunit [Pirellulales bacterium]